MWDNEAVRIVVLPQTPTRQARLRYAMIEVAAGGPATYLAASSLRRCQWPVGVLYFGKHLPVSVTVESRTYRLRFVSYKHSRPCLSQRLQVSVGADSGDSGWHFT
jgi:hypothetical protein